MTSNENDLSGLTGIDAIVKKPKKQRKQAKEEVQNETVTSIEGTILAGDGSHETNGRVSMEESMLQERLQSLPSELGSAGSEGGTSTDADNSDRITSTESPGTLTVGIGEGSGFNTSEEETGAIKKEEEIVVPTQSHRHRQAKLTELSRWYRGRPLSTKK